MKHSRGFFRSGWHHFWIQITKVIRNPVFFVLTLTGNATLASCATAFYFAESGVNPLVLSFSDAVWWAFATMTTVGYGDVVPVTDTGRIIAVCLMLTGGVLFLTFIALLSSAFTELEFLELQEDIRTLQRSLDKLLAEKSEHSVTSVLD